MLKKIFTTSIELILLIMIIYMFIFLIANPIPDHPFFDHSDEILVIAHRGGRRLWPENTLYAFENAVDIGVDVVEMDLHSTKDGVLVMMHDSTVDRTTDGHGAIQDFTLSELQGLDAGYYWTDDGGATYPFKNQGIQVPTLEEVFTTLPGVRMNIEIKQTEPPIFQPLCKMIREHVRTEQVLIASFDQDTIRDFRKACPEVATTAGETEVIILYGLAQLYSERLYSPGAEAVQVPERWGDIHVLTPRFIQAAKNRNMDVHAWTINELDDLQRILDLGVDGIITDYPDRLLDLLGR